MKEFIALIFVFLLANCSNTPAKEELFRAHEEELQKIHDVKSPDVKLLTEGVLIGDLIWKVENLDVDTFRNGDLIKEIRSDEEWAEAGLNGTPAWCYFNNNAEQSYGRLYNFHAVEDPRCLCPDAWRAPTDEDWIKLQLAIGENTPYQLKSKYGWLNNGNGIDCFGFNAKPNGMRYYDGQFFYYNESSFWWTSSSVVLKHAWVRYFEFDYSDSIFRITARKSAGLGIRCVKDYIEEAQ